MAKANLQPTGCVPQETLERNVEHCHSLGLPKVSQRERPVLAVVGGGHSVRKHLEELRQWPGDIWAICSTFAFLKSEGIDSTLFAVDPQAELAQMTAGVEKALLASYCHPSVFKSLEGKDVEYFDLGVDSIVHGPTTATAAPHLSIAMGYRDVHFFGIDSSYAGTEDSFYTHTYKTEKDPWAMKVECNGQAFLTGAEFILQAEMLSELMLAAPNVFRNRSEGFLGALIAAKGEYDLTHVSALMADPEKNTAYIEERLRRAA